MTYHNRDASHQSNLPTSVGFLMIHDKLLIACGQRVFHVSDLSAFGASPSDQRNVALGLFFSVLRSSSIGICEGIRVELSVRGEALGFVKDELLRNHLPKMFSLIKNEGYGD